MALRELVNAYQDGRINLSDYRSLRRKLLEKAAAEGETGPCQLQDTGQAPWRPGVRVWVIVLLIIAILALVTWLLR